MDNIFSMTATPLDSALHMTLYALSYLLVTGAVLAIGVSLCIYIDHRRRTRLSAAILDEEKTTSGEGGARESSEAKAGSDLPAARNDKAAPRPSDPQSHRDSTRPQSTNLQSSTHINECPPLYSSEYDATTPLRILDILDERSKPKHTISNPATLPPRPRTNTATHAPKTFTKYGMGEAAS